MSLTEESPIYGPFFGVMGAASAMIFSGNVFTYVHRFRYCANWHFVGVKYFCAYSFDNYG